MPHFDSGSNSRWPNLLTLLRDSIRRKRARRPDLHKLVFNQIFHLTERLNAVSDYLLALPSSASSVAITERIPVNLGNATEVCLFASYAAGSSLASYIEDHIVALSDAGIAVVLAVNAAGSHEQLVISDRLASRLAGCLVRENAGFDFAAWSHAYTAVTACQPAWKRLYLINDSIVGPLSKDSFTPFISRVRASQADLVGLTQNSLPQPHLQSYFLVANERLLQSTEFDCFMRGIVNLPTKIGVVAQYETQLTRFFRSRSYVCEALFAQIAKSEPYGIDTLTSDDTMSNWTQLLDAGFPYIKARVIKSTNDTARVKQYLPAEYWTYLR